MLLLDSGAVSLLADRSQRSLALGRSLRSAGLWPPVVPTVVLVECLPTRPGRDVNTNRFLKGCLVRPTLAGRSARRAADLRRRAGRGSVVDAALVALAEPDGTILTGDKDDLDALASHAQGVHIEHI